MALIGRCGLFGESVLFSFKWGRDSGEGRLEFSYAQATFSVPLIKNLWLLWLNLRLMIDLIKTYGSGVMGPSRIHYLCVSKWTVSQNEMLTNCLLNIGIYTHCPKRLQSPAEFISQRLTVKTKTHISEGVENKWLIST